MVWFQCEDCGENLKKPKLSNHFWVCSASKLSCIDCGEIFGQESVQGHTQCITEAEKYGPKGQGKFSNGATAKPKKDSKQKPEVDINVGLSERAPWSCSVCNTKATSKQTLLLHADGKKHRAKAWAIHKQQSQQNEVSSPDTKVPTENIPEGKLLDHKAVEEPKTQDLPKNIDIVHKNSEPSENGTFSSKKKRNHDASKNESDEKKTGSDDGEVTQVERAELEKTGSKVKKAKHNVLKEEEVVESGSTKEDCGKKIKWKKLVTSALKSNPDGILKSRKLRKLVLKALHESGISEEEARLSDILERKINSSSRFSVGKKYVRLVAKD